MIDLRNAQLPSYIEWGGNFAVIDTSFRTWIEFERYLREEQLVWGGIFPDGLPEDDGWVEAAIKFWKSENVTPRMVRPAPNYKTLDLILDGDYIVSSFQYAYGIDLTTEDMHWHRFKALLDGLPEDAKLTKIMAYRSYEKADDKRKYEDIKAEQKMAWSFPQEENEDAGFDALLSFLGV